jgi:hypothetical protein
MREAAEGEALPVPPAPFLARVAWASDDRDSTEQQEAVSPPKPEAVSIIAKDGPAGWLRDTEGNLWDVHSVAGLEVVHENYDGVARHKVLAHTACGMKTLFLQSGGPEAAEAYREEIAAKIANLSS